MAASQFDAERALIESFSSLDYTYVSYPNGPKLAVPSTEINYSIETIYAEGTSTGLSSTAATRYRGIFQVMLRVPVSAETGDAFGLYEAKESCFDIISLFKAGTVLAYPSTSPRTYVHCSAPIAKHLGKMTPEWYSIVVRVPFWEEISHG